MRVVAAATAFFIVLWSGMVALLWAVESDMVFMTGLSRSYTAVADPAIFRPRSFANDDGITLKAVMLSHDASEDRYWILFCPPSGTSTLVKRFQSQLHSLWELGYNVFAFDYRGFGANAGEPTEAGLYADAAAAYRYLTGVERVPASRLILGGRSLGSAVAAELATHVSAAGLILFAPIDSVPSAAGRRYPWAPTHLLARHQFDTRAKAPGINMPMVFFYGSPDPYLPPAAARSLFQRFHGPSLMVEDFGGHHDAGMVHKSQLNRALKTFWPVTTK